ncbi:T9SS C-terminal target domain-containing protein [Chryseobacterium sp. G0240]|uniref:T9SS type A sorting domain-containing protein n=1 Tax=Chryseobacterium sp. G0240 TaxID=2487066 RepID=UPI000F451A12|nr:T9SS type A sorting domain-containing protein [Chryseobacterium sp. G0240]ROI04601.1 T9SS C-terminal target domain-containing protein [Chryseobacterium sp. G0240]
MKLKLLLGTLIFTAISVNAQLSSINENFDSFNTGIGNPLPQNGWTSVLAGQRLYPDMANGNKYLQGYTFFSPNIPFYAITPQILAPNGSQSLSFTVALTAGSGGDGSIQVGLVSSDTDMSSFTPLGATVNITSSTPQTLSYAVPASTQQYIAFKFIGNVAHAAILIDDVVLTPAGTLGTNETVKSNENLRFAVTSDNTALQFISNKEPKNIQIYSASGQKAAEGKLKGHQFNISNLQSGVYYTVIETAEGKTISSKFIKK